MSTEAISTKIEEHGSHRWQSACSNSSKGQTFPMACPQSERPGFRHHDRRHGERPTFSRSRRRYSLSILARRASALLPPRVVAAAGRGARRASALLPDSMVACRASAVLHARAVLPKPFTLLYPGPQSERPTSSRGHRRCWQIQSQHTDSPVAGPGAVPVAGVLPTKQLQDEQLTSSRGRRRRWQGEPRG